jgi:3-phenylpropionate/trans-cinnamate dioxygenase ferredoxin subunit
MAEWVKVGEIGRGPAPGAVKVIMPRGLRLALANVDGEYFAIDDVCTHDGGPLGEGELVGDEIECPRHGALFNVRTGKAMTLPAILPVKNYPVKVDGDDILVELEGTKS